MDDPRTSHALLLMEHVRSHFRGRMPRRVARAIAASGFDPARLGYYAIEHDRRETRREAARDEAVFLAEALGSTVRLASMTD